MHHIGLQAKANLANGIQTSKPKNKFAVEIFLKWKIDQSKKKLTNQIRAVSRSSYEYVWENWLEVLEFIDLVRVQYSIFLQTALKKIFFDI